MEDQRIEMGIVKILANKGIPPFLLANNISQDNFSEVSLYKRDGMIIVDMFCTDEETGQPLRFRYKYDDKEVLLRIDMTVAGRQSLVFDRQVELERLLMKKAALLVIAP